MMGGQNGGKVYNKISLQVYANRTLQNLKKKSSKNFKPLAARIVYYQKRVYRNTL